MCHGGKCTVVKLGGSLLDLDDVADRLTCSVTELHNPVVVGGGGPTANLGRQWHTRRLVDSSEAHRLAIAAMSFNAVNLCGNDRRMCLVSSKPEATAAAKRGKVPLIDILQVLKSEQVSNPHDPGLPVSWDVTSDSIAAWLARVWEGELCLLKSVEAGSNPAVHLDAWFQSALGNRTQFMWVNLRSSDRVPTNITLSHTGDVNV